MNMDQESIHSHR